MTEKRRAVAGRPVILALCAGLVLSGCEHPDDGRSLGAAVGTILGAFLGAQIGSGAGQQLAIALGALGGGLLGAEIGEGLSSRDQELIERSTYEALDTGEPTGWENPETGARGYTEPGDEIEYQPSGVSDDGETAGVPTIADMEDPAGEDAVPTSDSAGEVAESGDTAVVPTVPRVCRPAKITVILPDGGKRERDVLACKSPDGDWEIEESTS